MPGPSLTVFVDGTPVAVPLGTTAAVAVMIAGRTGFRRSVTGEARGPLCGMGVCFECRLTIDGHTQQRSCQVTCRDGMELRTDG